MENVEKEMSSDTPQLISDKDPKAVVKATVFLVQKGIKDQVFSVRPWIFDFFSQEWYKNLAKTITFHVFPGLQCLPRGVALFGKDLHSSTQVRI